MKHSAAKSAANSANLMQNVAYVHRLRPIRDQVPLKKMSEDVGWRFFLAHLSASAKTTRVEQASTLEISGNIWKLLFACHMFDIFDIFDMFVDGNLSGQALITLKTTSTPMSTGTGC